MQEKTGRKKYRVMAYILSSGLWDALGPISLESLLGFKDEELSNALEAWQVMYDDQFRKSTYTFDWSKFNQIGEELTRKIREKLPGDVEIIYEPSDDREFFSPEDCEAADMTETAGRDREISLRERKRALLYKHVAWSD